MYYLSLQHIKGPLNSFAASHNYCLNTPIFFKMKTQNNKKQQTQTETNHQNPPKISNTK